MLTTLQRCLVQSGGNRTARYFWCLGKNIFQYFKPSTKNQANFSFLSGRYAAHDRRQRVHLHNPLLPSSWIIYCTPRDYCSSYRWYISWRTVLSLLPPDQGHRERNQHWPNHKGCFPRCLCSNRPRNYLWYVYGTNLHNSGARCLHLLRAIRGWYCGSYFRRKFANPLKSTRSWGLSLGTTFPSCCTPLGLDGGSYVIKFEHINTISPAACSHEYDSEHCMKSADLVKT